MPRFREASAATPRRVDDRDNRDDSLKPRPKPDPRDSPDTPDTPEDNEPDTVATPEGDGEAPPDAPLKPAPDGLQRTPSIDVNKL
jgi:hypothetical protein